MADTPDPLTTAIESNATSPQTVSSDGTSVTNNQLSEQIEAKKFLDANAALAGIANGTAWFPRMRMVPPGARGGHHCEGH